VQYYIIVGALNWDLAESFVQLILLLFAVQMPLTLIVSPEIFRPGPSGFCFDFSMRLLKIKFKTKATVARTEALRADN
jgi:hypothetical protein